MSTGLFQVPRPISGRPDLRAEASLRSEKSELFRPLRRGCRRPGTWSISRRRSRTYVPDFSFEADPVPGGGGYLVKRLRAVNRPFSRPSGRSPEVRFFGPEPLLDASGSQASKGASGEAADGSGCCDFLSFLKNLRSPEGLGRRPVPSGGGYLFAPRGAVNRLSQRISHFVGMSQVPALPRR